MNAINKNSMIWCMRCYKHFNSNYARLCNECMDDLTITKLKKIAKSAKPKKCVDCGAEITHASAFAQCHKCMLIKMITSI